MSFSHKQAAIDAVAREIRRNRTMAINGNNPEFVIKHPDWVRDAKQKQFTMLDKVVKERMLKAQKLALDRRIRIGASFSTGKQIG